MNKLILLLLLFVNVHAFEVFNNGKIIIGNDGNESNITQDSVSAISGLLEQPWYEDSAKWYKLTFSNYGLSMGIAFDSNNVFTGGRNANVAGYIAPTSVEINSSLVGGIGLLYSSSDFNISNKLIKVTQRYELQANKSFIKTTTTVENVSGTDISDLRIWVGTNDDYVGSSDITKKEKGNIVNNAFVINTDKTEVAKVLKISSTSGISSVILFYTTDNRANMAMAPYDFSSFLPLMNQNPLDTNITLINDGSYGMKVSLGDMHNAETRTFSWYYLAGNISDIASIIDEVTIDSNPKPTDILLDKNNVDENQNPGAKVGELSAVDNDEDDTHIFTLTCNTSGVDDSAFYINNSTLKLENSANFEVKSSYDICIHVEDSTLNVLDKNFTISINDLADTPSITECNAEGVIANIGLFEDCNADNDADGFTPLGGDCNDNDASINPNAVEIPNNSIDEDCSGEDLVRDEDGDGFTPNNGDCNDTNSSIFAGATEIPNNGIDEDCSGEDLVVESLLDHDGDGVTPADGDCNDNNSSIFPNAPEIPNNGIDEDCSGEDLVDESLLDIDGDGFTPAQGDCNDFNSAINPQAQEIVNNAIDEDCSGADLIDNNIINDDKDGDGFTPIGGDCNDHNSAINPNATEIPNNGIDEDCSGEDEIDTRLIDADGDGFTPAQGDCNDYNSAINPNAHDIANNNVDEDCNGQDATDTTFIDSDGDGFSPADGDCNDNNISINPVATEIANNAIDDDCSGGDLVDPSSIDEDNDGFTPSSGDCNDKNSSINPNASEIANNGVDEDCSGADSVGEESQSDDVDGDGFSIADGDCNDLNNAIFPTAVDVEDNGIDEDCSGSDAKGVHGYELLSGECFNTRENQGITFATLSDIQEVSIDLQSAQTQAQMYTFLDFNDTHTTEYFIRYNDAIEKHYNVSVQEGIDFTQTTINDGVKISTQQSSVSLYNNALIYLHVKDEQDDSLSEAFVYHPGVNLSIDSDKVTFNYTENDASLELKASVKVDDELNVTLMSPESFVGILSSVKNAKMILNENSTVQIHSSIAQENGFVNMIIQADTFLRTLHVIQVNESLYSLVSSVIEGSISYMTSEGIETRVAEKGCDNIANIVASTTLSGKITTSFEYTQEQMLVRESTLAQNSSFEAGSSVSIESIGHCKPVIRILTPLHNEIEFN